MCSTPPMGKAGGGGIREGLQHRLLEEGGPRKGIQGKKWEARSHVAGCRTLVSSQ